MGIDKSVIKLQILYIFISIGLLYLGWRFCEKIFFLENWITTKNNFFYLILLMNVFSGMLSIYFKRFLSLCVAITLSLAINSQAKMIYFLQIEYFRDVGVQLDWYMGPVVTPLFCIASWLALYILDQCNAKYSMPLISIFISILLIVHVYEPPVL